MLPLGLLTAAQGQAIMVELKNGESLNGHLIACDTWMNLTLKKVILTSVEGNKFHRLPEAYIKYLRLGEEVLDKVREQQALQQASRGGRGGGQRGDHRGDRGGRGGMGRGGGRGRGRGGRGG